MTRTQIRNKVKTKEAQIKKLDNEIIELYKRDYLLCDKKQWFKEEEETHGRGKKKETNLVGRIYWKEGFKDEDTGKIIMIERSQSVRVNGEWI